MQGDSQNSSRVFHPHNGERLRTLDGIPLATFGQRALGFLVDIVLVLVLWLPLEFLWRHFVMRQPEINLHWDFHEVGNLLVMLLYWASFNYFGNGRTPGKGLARTRTVSLTSERLGLWQSVERALGYGAAVLEGGLGFAQFFWDKNRMCAQDRLSETIVIDLRKARKTVAPTTAAEQGVAPAT